MLASFDSISNMRLFWQRVQEPELKSYRREAYRLTIVDTRTRTTEIYRLEKRDDGYTLKAKKYKPIRGNRERDKLLWEQNSEITNDEWDGFIEQTAKQNLWIWPVRIKRESKEGKSWIFEASMPNKGNCTERSYHLVSRWEPQKNTEFFTLSKTLMGFNPDK